MIDHQEIDSIYQQFENSKQQQGSSPNYLTLSMDSPPSDDSLLESVLPVRIPESLLPHLLADVYIDESNREEFEFFKHCITTERKNWVLNPWFRDFYLFMESHLTISKHKKNLINILLTHKYVLNSEEIEHRSFECQLCHKNFESNEVQYIYYNQQKVCFDPDCSQKLLLIQKMIYCLFWASIFPSSKIGCFYLVFLQYRQNLIMQQTMFM